MAMIRIDLLPSTDVPAEPIILRADLKEARAFAEMRRHLRATRSQWVYYERNLRIYEETTTYLCKPRQRLLWTQSQALLDASEVIAETLMGQEA